MNCARLVGVSWTGLGFGKLRQFFTYAEAVERSLSRQRNGTDDTCEASRRAWLIDSDMAKTFAVIETHREGQDLLNTFDRKFGDMGISPQGALKAALQASFDLVAGAAVHLKPSTEQWDLAHAHPAFLDQEEAFALTQTFSDGSAFIRISTALLTACDLMWTVNRLLKSHHAPSVISSRAASGRLDRTARACVAALRFYLIHQRTFGIAAKVLPPLKPRLRDVARVRPASFVMAHELGHHLLRHTAGVAFMHDQEIQADVFASRVLHQMIGGPVDSEGGTLEVIFLALAALDLHAGGLYVRVPTSHPDVPARWRAVVSSLPAVPDGFVPDGSAELLAITREAMDTSKPLDESDWACLSESRDWDTTFHDENYFTWMRGLDQASGYTREQVLGLLERFSSDTSLATGLSVLWETGLEACLDYWGLRVHPYLLDPSRPLGHFELAEILTKTLLSGIEEQATRQSIAALLASELSTPIRRAC